MLKFLVPNANSECKPRKRKEREPEAVDCICRGITTVGYSPSIRTMQPATIDTNRVRHTEGNTGEKSYKCDFEGFDFECIRRDGLKSHMYRHTGEKPFKCAWVGCGFRSARYSGLGTHMWTHTGETPTLVTSHTVVTRAQLQLVLKFTSEGT